MNTWFTSDTHYSHRNITGKNVSTWTSGYRRFNYIEEMNNTLIENINKCVAKDDVLYHLGDWSFGGSLNILIFREAIKCKNIHLILGNHDKHIANKNIDIGGYEFNPMNLFSTISKDFKGKIEGEKFYLCHYYNPEWETFYKDYIHLFGHYHGGYHHETKPIVGRSKDVGVDTHKEFRPYHVDEIIKIFCNE